jgi:DNA-binding transcriptional regulator YdaS (Cro superfamily)
MGSQKALADHVGVSGNRITDWKTGVRECPPEKVALIADAAKLPADQWLARAVLWRQMGKPDEARLRAALGKWARVTGAVAVFASVVDMVRHSTMYRVLISTLAGR